MLQYKIVNQSLIEEFIRKTGNAIAEGWEPLGGVQVVVEDKYFNKRFYQAMIRETNSDKAMVRRLQKAQRDGGIGAQQWYRDELASALEQYDTEENQD